jgi:predicted TIM-barrel fold metal-dependent hydrolase
MHPFPFRSLLLSAAAAIVLSAPASAAGEPAPAFTEILKIDTHSHVFEDIPELNALMRSVNVRTINVCNNGTDGYLETMHAIALQQYRRHPDLYPFESTFDLLRRDEPTYVQEVIAHLDRTFAQGAIGVKIWKEIGIDIKDRNGRYILPDDPLFDPIYAHIAKRGKVLHAHLAEPIDAWLPLDPNSNHYHYYSTNPEWHLYGKPEYPSHAAIIAARDNIMRKHPSLVVLGAHLGSLEHDLEGIAERLEKYPNFHIEVSARTRNLTRHPSEKVRALFLKHPDRILYGIDAGWKPYRLPAPPSEAQRQGYINRLRLQYRADYDYYAGSGETTYNNRRVEALNLPRSVLEKFYHRNAMRLYKLEQAWANPAATQ